MATETRLAPTYGVYGETLSLTTAKTGVYKPPSRNGMPPRSVMLYSGSAFRYQITPTIIGVFKTANLGSTYTDYTANAKDRVLTNVITLNSLDTWANGDALYVISKDKFGGIIVNNGLANANASVMSVFYDASGTWTDITATDGTDNAGASLGSATTIGNITWTTPTDWTESTINGIKGFAVRIQFSAALDSATNIREIALLPPDDVSGYGEAAVPYELGLGGDQGGIAAYVASGTGTLDITWVF